MEMRTSTYPNKEGYDVEGHWSVLMIVTSMSK